MLRNLLTIAAILLLVAAYGYVGHSDERSARQVTTFRNMHA